MKRSSFVYDSVSYNDGINPSSFGGNWPYKSNEAFVPDILPYSLYKAALLRARECVNVENLGEKESARLNVIANTSFAVGHKTESNGTESIFVEVRDASDFIQCAYASSNNPETNVKYCGSLYKKSTQKFAVWDLAKYSHYVDTAAIWTLAIQSELDTMVSSEIQQIIDDIAIAIAHLDDDISVDLGIKAFRRLAVWADSYNGYHAPASGSYPNFSQSKVRKGELVPIKNVIGEFEVLRSGSDSKDAIIFNAEDYRNLACFSEVTDPAMIARIPTISETHVVSKEEKAILDAIKQNENADYSSQITNIILNGPAGVGKSEAVRFICGVLGRPLLTQTFSAGTCEDDLLDHLMPCVEDGVAEATLTSEELLVYHAICSSPDGDRNSMMNAAADVLELPTLEECFLMPAFSYETLTGNNREDITPSEVAKVLDQRIGAKIGNVIAKLKASGGGNGGVTYKCIPSPIVEAIRCGYAIELQEPTNVQNQGIFSALYDVLEKASVGTLQTTMGPVQRHPDFMCFCTTNHGYAGNKPLSVPFESRMQLNLEFEPPTKETLIQRIIRKFGATDIATITQCVDVYDIATTTAKELGTRGEGTPRSLYAFTNAVLKGTDAMSAFKMYLLNFFSHDYEEKAEILEAVEAHPLFA